MLRVLVSWFSQRTCIFFPDVACFRNTCPLSTRVRTSGHQDTSCVPIDAPLARPDVSSKWALLTVSATGRKKKLALPKSPIPDIAVTERDVQLLIDFRRFSTMAIPRSIVSHYATTPAERLDGAVTNHQSRVLPSKFLTGLMGHGAKAMTTAVRGRRSSRPRWKTSREAAHWATEHGKANCAAADLRTAWERSLLPDGLRIDQQSHEGVEQLRRQQNVGRTGLQP